MTIDFYKVGYADGYNEDTSCVPSDLDPDQYDAYFRGWDAGQAAYLNDIANDTVYDQSDDNEYNDDGFDEAKEWEDYGETYSDEYEGC